MAPPTAGVKSAKLKLLRAAKHLRAVKRCVALYAASQPHKIIPQSTSKKKLNVPKRPPMKISIMVGEMVYQMRSALDHLAFELVKLNPGVDAIDAKWRERCQFPLRTKLPRGCTPPCAKSEFSRDLPGISDKAFAVIEGMQPYYGVGALNNCLGFLAHLSNIDKHRHLNLIRPRVRKSESVRFASGLTSVGHQALDRGAIIEAPRGWNESDKPVYVNRRYQTFVAFNERDHLGDATTLSVPYLMTLILDQINLFAIPALHKLIKNP